MDELLPNLNELRPINEYWKTFSETPLTKDFEDLCFPEKLQVINDIVRQTILFDDTPNIETHIEKMTGDSYTVSLVAIEYLKKLNIGHNHMCVLGKQRKFDSDDVESTHILVLVDDENGITYQMDCTPEVGYKYGAVSALNDERFYRNYYNIDGEVEEGIKIIK